MFFLILVYVLFIEVHAILDFQCLRCICETATKCSPLPCDLERCREIEPNNFSCACGYFAITPPYWISGNRPHLNQSDENDADKFEKCVLTKRCSIMAVQYYMEKNAEDCDGNKVIDCDDYVLIHSFGKLACSKASLTNDKLEIYNTCMGRKILTNPETTVPQPQNSTNKTT